MSLEHLPEATLLQMVLDILSADGPVTDVQKQELQAINSEIERREILQGDRPLYAVRRHRQRIIDATTL